VGVYERHVLPRLIRAAMRQEILLPYRQRIVPAAEGRVLELGVGSGLNLALYEKATHVIGLDPSSALLSTAHEAMTRARRPVDLLQASAESIPLVTHSVDTVVTTWTLCSIPDVSRALREARRVLKPSGRLLFVEHGRAPDAGVVRWQNLLTPAWRRIAGGCHLNRAIGQLVEQAGFRLEHVHTGYMKGPRLMTFMYEGSARPA
jgi:ubiquinone/menaquinone biosynthesis C-methylase UbiE